MTETSPLQEALLAKLRRTLEAIEEYRIYSMKDSHPAEYANLVAALSQPSLNRGRLAKALMTTDSVPMPHGWAGYRRWADRIIDEYDRLTLEDELRRNE